ncbi:MAG: hypothetical protein DA330_08580 [Nitrososphaera sp.]|nr:hypothetical protein [Nitrososphaera sp.]
MTILLAPKGTGFQYSCAILAPVEMHRKANIVLDQTNLMQKCTCGRETKSFDACSPMGCTTFVVCSGCFKEVQNCTCEST